MVISTFALLCLQERVRKSLFISSYWFIFWRKKGFYYYESEHLLKFKHKVLMQHIAMDSCYVHTHVYIHTSQGSKSANPTKKK